MFPLPSQNAVGVCNHITPLIPCYITSRLVTLLKVTDAPVQAPNIIFSLQTVDGFIIKLLLLLRKQNNERHVKLIYRVCYETF